MRLTELDPKFQIRSDVGEHVYRIDSDHRETADGVRFLCPLCFKANGGRVGTHQVVCWFRGRVPDSAVPGPGRWDVTGDSFENLTLKPSVHLTGIGCGWHGFVTNGEVT